MPEKGQDVLLWLASQEGFEKVEFGWWDGCCFSHCSGMLTVAYKKEVTHWRPLTPPEAQQ
jgi:hypothetical protein